MKHRDMKRLWDTENMIIMPTIDLIRFQKGNNAEDWVAIFKVIVSSNLPEMIISNQILKCSESKLGWIVKKENHTQLLSSELPECKIRH